MADATVSHAAMPCATLANAARICEADTGRSMTCVAAAAAVVTLAVQQEQVQMQQGQE